MSHFSSRLMDSPISHLKSVYVRKLIITICSIFFILPMDDLQAQSASIDRIVGKVYLQRGTNDHQLLSTGANITVGDKLISEKNSKATINLPDGSVISLAPESEMIVTSLIFDRSNKERKTLIEVITGMLRMLVPKFSENFASDIQVKAPNAIAGVRGTEFIVAYSEKEKTSIFNLEGQVAVTDNNGKEILLPSNQFVAVRSNLVGVKPQAIPDTLRNQLKAITSLRTVATDPNAISQQKRQLLDEQIAEIKNVKTSTEKLLHEAEQKKNVNAIYCINKVLKPMNGLYSAAVRSKEQNHQLAVKKAAYAKGRVVKLHDIALSCAEIKEGPLDETVIAMKVPELEDTLKESEPEVLTNLDSNFGFSWIPFASE